MMARQEIVDVWRDNLDAELSVIRELVDEYPYVGMDTEFPGVVARPIGTFRGPSDYHYQTLRCNVDLLRIIQLGLTLCDGDGRRPEPTCTWQFNFRFSLDDDMYAPESIDLLQGSGLDFRQHEDHGISAEYFGEVLVSSGLVLLPDVRWISFHSGYDFGYILKTVSLVGLPVGEDEFFDLLRIWFPCVYDIKFIMRSCKSLRGGLNDVAKDLGVPRHGTEHQAGSDSLLTADVFFALRSQFFDGHLDDSKFLGQIHGLGSSSSRAPAVGDRSGGVGGVGVGETSGSIADDALALSTEPLPSTLSSHHHHHHPHHQQPPGSAGRRYPMIGTPAPGSASIAGVVVGAGPRASSAVSIKNPNAIFTPAASTTTTTAAAAAAAAAAAVEDGQGRTASPAVR